MKAVLALVAGILLSLAGLASPLSAATVTVYTVSDFLGPVTLGGTITTDGNIGSLLLSDITDFDVTFTTAVGASHVTKSTVGTDFIVSGTALTATSGGLFFNFSGVGSFNIFNHLATTQWLMCAGPGSCTPNNDWFVNGGGKSNVILGETANVEIAIGPPEPIVTTPLPAALPLFATGLGALTLLGWRRKRNRLRLISPPVPLNLIEGLA